MSYFLQKTLLPSSAVTDCVCCKFTSKNTDNLILVKNNRLFLYRINGKDLTLLKKREIYGNIESILNIDQHILLTFEKEAKISVISFDERFFDIKTESLHYFEDTFLKEGCLTFNDYAGRALRVDKDHRFCVCLFYNTKMSVLSLSPKEDSIFTQSTGNQSQNFVQDQFILDLEKHDIRIVKDYTFLDASESILWILHENTQTWSGRIDCSHNTSLVSQITFHDDRNYTVAHWRIEGLPHDIMKIIALSNSVGGGCIAVGYNSLLYLNRRKIIMGLSLNDFTKLEEMKIKLKPTPDPIHFEMSDYVFVNDETILFGLTSGRMYMLHLVNNGSIVRDMELSKLMATVRPSCLCRLPNKLLFIGSMVGDSILANFQKKKRKKRDRNEEETGDEITQESKKNKLNDDEERKRKENEENEAKKKEEEMIEAAKILEEEEEENKEEEEEEDIAPMDEDSFLDMLEMDDNDNKEKEEEEKKKKLMEEETEGEEDDDSTQNIDNNNNNDRNVDDDNDEYKHLFGIENDMEDEEIDSMDYSLDYVTSFPSISSLSKFLVIPLGGKKFVPNLDDNLQIVACCGYGRNGSIARLNRSIRPYLSKETKLPFDCLKLWNVNLRIHNSRSFKNHVVFSRENKTTILDGDKLEEVSERSRIYRRQQTLYLSNVNNGESVIQITKSKILVLKRGKYTFTRTFPHNVHFACIRNHFAVVLLKNSFVYLVKVNNINRDASMNNVSDRISKKFGKITALTLFEDKNDRIMFRLTESSKKKKVTKSTTKTSSTAKTTTTTTTKRGRKKKDEKTKDYDSKHYLFVVYTSGVLEIYSVPEMKSVFVNMNFLYFYNTILDDGKKYEETHLIDRKRVIKPYVSEILLQNLGNKKTEDPHLLVMLSDGTLVTYRTFTYEKFGNKNRRNQKNILKVPDSEIGRLSSFRMTKVNHGLILKKRRPIPVFSTRSYTFSNVSEFHSKFVPFDNINGIGGVFICGSQPAWIFSSEGSLVVHPMLLDGPIYAFAPYNHEKLKDGFLYCSNGGNLLKFCHLDRDENMNYITEWPCKKIPLYQTPVSLCHDHSEKTVMVTTCKDVLRRIEDEEEVYTRIPNLVEQKYRITMYSQNFRVEDTIDDFERHERVNDCQILSLMKGEGDAKNFVNLMVIATGFSRGEDSHGKGRVIIYDFRGEFDQKTGEKRLKFEKLNSKELKGSVSCLGQVEGWLIVTIGVKIYIYYYDWDANQLIPAAFHDTQFFITKIISIKNYVLYCDIFRSLNLLRWVEDGNKLYLLGRDNNPNKMYQVDAMLHNRMLFLVGYDRRGNVSIYHFQPMSKGFEGGEKLIRVADFHIGENVNATYRLKSKLRSKGEKNIEYDENNQFNIFSTRNGAIGYIIRIEEKIYNTLQLLQGKLYTSVPHAAGLHPKTYRLFNQDYSNRFTAKKNVIDGDLTWSYELIADRRTQEQIARMIGSTRDRIVSRIDSIERKTFFF